MTPPDHSPERASQPTLQFLLRHPAHFIALGCGSGLAPVAPGTFGALFGWLVARVLLDHVTTPAYAAIVVACFVAGCWAAAVTGPKLGRVDHGAIVWDEVVAMLIVIWFVPSSFTLQVLGFLFFRFFDIVKPPPIRWFDANIKNGFGVMLDDLVAAFFALLCLAIWMRI